VTPTNPRILTINGGSSSIKFALFDTRDSHRRILEGKIGSTPHRKPEFQLYLVVVRRMLFTGSMSREFRGIFAGEVRPREEERDPSVACRVRLPAYK
jgi:hypothetical protein